MGKKKILMIEDNPDERLLQRTILEKAGYEVLEADNGKDGLNLALTESPDLILLDIRLPCKSKGIGLAKLLREDERTKDTPIVFVSAHFVFKDSNIIKTISNSGFFVKSPDLAGFLEYIARFLKD